MKENTQKLMKEAENRTSLTPLPFPPPSLRAQRFTNPILALYLAKSSFVKASVPSQQAEEVRLEIREEFAALRKISVRAEGGKREGQRSSS